MSKEIRPIPCNPATRKVHEEMLSILTAPTESSEIVARMAEELREMNKPTVGFSSGCGAAQTRGF